MDAHTNAAWIVDVENAFKRYQRSGDLVQHAAQHWPAVRERAAVSTNVADAIRDVLRHAVDELAERFPNDAAMLRSRYMLGDSMKQGAFERGYDLSTVYRHRGRALREVAHILHKQNQLAERRARFRRFAVQHPVEGVEPITADLVARLCDAAGPPIIVLEGMGGLGKTTLAKRVAQHFIHDDIFVRVLWASAQQFQWDQWMGQQRIVHAHALNPADIVRQLAEELGMEVHGDLHTLQTDVVAHCARYPYLVVVDNLETVADMEALAPLIGALTGASRVLLTTRDRAPHALPADVPRHYVPLNELDDAASIRLLRSAARYTGATAIQAAPDAELQRIYAVTGGNPLALWLVAAQATNVPWQTFLNDLVERCPPGSTGDELYNFLYRRSWEQLSADAQMVLFAMHRCEAGADYELLQELSELEQDAWVRAVEEVRRRMLLLFDGTTYTIHRLTYTFLRAVIAGWR